MEIMVVDGMGGGIGRAIVERIRLEAREHTILAVGANAIATAAMLKAGAHQAATGENAVVVNSGRVDCIVGTVGIVMANAMLGEITPRMAEALASSKATKILIPASKCNTLIAGVAEKPTAQYINEIPLILSRLASEKENA